MPKHHLALYGGKPTKGKPFPEWPVYDDNELFAVNAVIESRQWWRTNGTQVSTFEKEFATYHDAKYALAVTNGTQAIEVSLASLNIGDGDEVILPAFTFISTASAILCANAVPILVDVNPDTYCMDPMALAAAITPRTKAIIPVHMAGHVADMDAIREIGHRYDLSVIEDAAHAQGAKWKDSSVGCMEIAGIFSFQAGKLMTAGEGGIILSNSEEFIERCFLYGNCGRPAADRTYQHTVLGTNCRLSELQAAVLRVQLKRLDEQIERRERLGALLDEHLRKIPGISPQGRDHRVTRHSHYMYMFRYNNTAFGGFSRLSFVDALIAEGIPAFVAYPAIHRTPLFKNNAFGPRWSTNDPRLPDYSQVHCPIAEEIGDQVVWLHHRVLLGDEEDISEIAECIKKIQAYALDI